MSKVLAACLIMAAQTYNVPPAVLVGIYNVEGGRVGQQVKNDNGTYDLGPMQINTLWLPELAEYWGVSHTTAKQWVRDDACTNMGVSAWILRQHLNETGSLSQAIAHYHSRTANLGSKYRNKVVSAMERQGLLRPPSGASAQNTQVAIKATQSDRFGKQARRSAPTQEVEVAVQQPSRGTVGLKGAQQEAKLVLHDDPYFPIAEKIGMNSIVVHNPISRVRD